MKIGIIAAMPQEIIDLNQVLQYPKTEKIGQWTFYQGSIGSTQVVLVESGIGKVLSAMTATLLVREFGVGLIINTGSAGGLGQGLQIGDLVIASHLAYGDSDVTAFGYAFGQMPGMPATYQTQEDLAQFAAKLAQEKGYRIHLGLVTSSDSFIHREDQRQGILSHFPQVLATEMEGASIAQAAYALGVGLLVIRAISDIPESGDSAVDFNSFIEEAGAKSALFVQDLLTTYHWGD